MKILDISQGSPEWFEARVLKMTASKAQAIGSDGAGLRTYALEICAEHLSRKEKEHFSNKHTERGNTFEDEARTIYEFKTGEKVQTVGFVEHSEFVGCSPDGLVGDKGLIEIKCPDDKAYLSFLLTGKIPSGYLWQMQMQMYICGREWCDFVMYNNNFEKSIIIKRVYIDSEYTDKLVEGFSTGKSLILSILDEYNKLGKENING